MCQIISYIIQIQNIYPQNKIKNFSHKNGKVILNNIIIQIFREDAVNLLNKRL